MIQFRVNAVPVAQPRQRHRSFQVGGKTITQNYCPKSHPVHAFKAAVQQAVTQVHRTAPLAGPIHLSVVFLMPRPGRLIWKTKPMPRVYHASKPDDENLLKSLQDSLTALAWIDDAQVCSLRLEKWYAAGDEPPGVEVTIESLEPKA